MDEDAWTEYLNRDDNVIKNALEVFRKNEAFPKNNEKSDKQKK
jgi:carboxyl-terminal processing protease